MGEKTNGMVLSLTATTAVPARTFVKFGAADGTMVPAVDGTAMIAGVAGDIDTAVGEHGDAFGQGNVKDIIYGGTVARGDPLTADGSGRAIKATATGTYCGGFAEKSGVVGDIGHCTVAPFIL